METTIEDLFLKAVVEANGEDWFDELIADAIAKARG
jgi:hypothetical protein